MSGHGGGGGHRGRDEVRTPALALPSLEITIARRGAALARFEFIGIHSQTHAAAGLAPLEAGGREDLVEPLDFGLPFDPLAAGHDHRLHAVGDTVSPSNGR